MKTKMVFLLIAMMVMGNGFCQQSNVILTAPDILSVFSDPRGISLGNSGVASEADVFSMYYNPAKYAFIKETTSLGLSYVPIVYSHFASLAYVQKLGKISTIAASIRYFDSGEIALHDEAGNGVNYHHSIDFTLDFAYSAQLTDHLSLAAAVRFISSKTYSWWT